MANFYVHVQPSGNSGEYLVNLFFTDMQSAFNTSSYLSVGLCSESFADGAASVSGVLWEENATPYFYGNWHYRQLSTSDANSFYPNGSYTLYAFARDADNGQYWNFNAGTAVQLRIRPVVRNVSMRSNYAAITLSDLCAQWTRMNFDSIGLSPIDFYDGSAYEFSEGYWEVIPSMNAPQNDAFTAELYLDEGMVAQREYIFYPYARLPNGEIYHLLAPGETITFTYVPAPDGPVTVTGKPEQLMIGHYYADQINVFMEAETSYNLNIKLTRLETGEVRHIRNYSMDAWGETDAEGHNSEAVITELAPSSTYKIELRYYLNGSESREIAVCYGMTKPKIDKAEADIHKSNGKHMIWMHVAGSMFTGAYAELRTSGSSSDRKDWFYYDDGSAYTDLEFTKEPERLTNYSIRYYVYVQTSYLSPYEHMIRGECDTETYSDYKSFRVQATEQPRYFRWTTCADDNGHKRARAAPAVMTKAEWDALQQTVRDMIDYRGGGAEYNMGAANIGDPVSADLYDAVRTAIRGAGNGSEYGNFIPEIHRKDMMYASHFNALMDELNAASGYNVNISN